MALRDEHRQTLTDILLNQNARHSTAIELQCRNFLALEVGDLIFFEDKINSFDFSVEKVEMHETVVEEDIFYHTDYHLISSTESVKFKLRLISVPGLCPLSTVVQLFQVDDQKDWNEEFYNRLNDNSGIIEITHDNFGNELDPPHKYWRIEDVLDAYHSRAICVKDEHGYINLKEVDGKQLCVTFWDFHRDTINQNGPIREFLIVEMNNRCFTILRGIEINSSQVTVVKI